MKQAEIIFTTICEENCQVKKLKIGWNNLSALDCILLARTVIRLGNVELDYSKLTKQQNDAILAAP